MSAVHQTGRPAMSHRFLRVGLWSLAGLLLAMPVVAMQFTTEMNWGAEDFLAAALLIGGAGLTIELAVRLLLRSTERWLAGGAILAMLLVWAELAVGVLH